MSAVWAIIAIVGGLVMLFAIREVVARIMYARALRDWNTKILPNLGRLSAANEADLRNAYLIARGLDDAVALAEFERIAAERGGKG